MDAPLSLEPFSAMPRGHTGAVALLGRPNTGKSTVINTILQYHLVPVSEKPQTTRRNSLGIHTTENAQILFLDAPGVHLGRDALDEAMNQAVTETLKDADIILVLCDPTRPPGQEDTLVAERAGKARSPVFLAINKMDAASPQQIDEMEAFYAGFLTDAPIYRISALQRETLEPLLKAITQTLPEGPFLFPTDDLTNVSERDLAVELIREALLEVLRDEIPHAIAITIEEWQDRPDGGSTVNATLHVERENHKYIVIGRKGSMIQRLRREAARRLNALCGRPIDLHLWVKNSPKWRKNKRALREFRF
jgi:GTP-binding protein Era